MNNEKLSKCCNYPTYEESGDCGKCGSKSKDETEKSEKCYSCGKVPDLFGRCKCCNKDAF